MQKLIEADKVLDYISRMIMDDHEKLSINRVYEYVDNLHPAIALQWHSMQDSPPPAGVRVLFGCTTGYVCEGFMCYFDRELRPVRFDGDRSFFGNSTPLPHCWTELPKAPTLEEVEGK